MAERCDAVVVVGSDYTDVGTPTEFSYNARIAANLGAPVLLVLNGADRSAADLHTVADMAAAELRANHGTLFAVVANRVGPRGRALPGQVEDALANLDVPVYVVPDEPMLTAPSVADLLAAVGGTLLSGDPALLAREATGFVVAA